MCAPFIKMCACVVADADAVADIAELRRGSKSEGADMDARMSASAHL